MLNKVQYRHISSVSVSVSVTAETENVVSATVSVTAVTGKVVSVGLYLWTAQKQRRMVFITVEKDEFFFIG